MQITVYGYIFIPLLFALLVLRPKYLIYVLIFSLTLQVTSIFNVGDYSMQIYRFITLLLSIRFLIYLFMNRVSIRLKHKEIKNVIIYGSLFTVFVILWSYLAPIIFSGYPVYPPDLSIDYSALFGPSPLHFSIYNIAMNAYVLLYFLSLVYISILSWTIKDLFIVRWVIFFSFCLVILTSVSQSLNYLFGTVDFTQYIYTVTTRALHYDLIGSFLPIPRIQATYFEPSNLAPFLIALYAYYLYSLFTRFKFINILFCLLFFIMILLSASTTAYLSLLVVTFLVLLYVNPVKISKLGIRIKKNVLFLLFGLFLLFLIILVVIYFTIGFQIFNDLVNVYLVYKSSTRSFLYRTTADLYALHLFLNTFGLGVGLGSNRPSSLIPYLLSQLGILGTILFIIFMFKLIQFCYQTLKDTEYFAFFFLIPSVLLTQIIAYPDITNPTLWQFIYVSLLACFAIRNNTYQPVTLLKR